MDASKTKQRTMRDMLLADIPESERTIQRRESAGNTEAKLRTLIPGYVDLLDPYSHDLLDVFSRRYLDCSGEELLWKPWIEVAALLDVELGRQGKVGAREFHPQQREPDSPKAEARDVKPPGEFERKAAIDAYRLAWKGAGRPRRELTYPAIAKRANQQWNHRSVMDKWVANKGTSVQDRMIRRELQRLPG